MAYKISIIEVSLKTIMNSIAKLFGFQAEQFIVTPEHKNCLDILENTNQSILITGKAGTGKSALIQHFRVSTKKKVVVIAPTGIAALNVRGQTIHSFFKFPPRIINAAVVHRRNVDRIYSDIDTIIVDEVSMVRADLIDGMDAFLRRYGKDKNLPFGGVQMVFVGDMYQLPPVVSFEEREVFDSLYPSPYFFSASVFEQEIPQILELTTVFRQKDIEFVGVLNNIRIGQTSMELLEPINKRVNNEVLKDDYIILCTTNKTAEGVNQTKLNGINRPEFKYQATIEGDFPTEENTVPALIELRLKKGARVLFIKNDKGGQWVNGSLGTVHAINETSIQVLLDENGKLVTVETDEWENIKYELNEKTGELTEKIKGKLKQYPLKLAWAITIHKSQGMSFDKVCVDFSRSPFAHGQTYVALSRCRTLEGLLLTRKIWPNDVVIDQRIIEFYKNVKS